MVKDQSLTMLLFEVETMNETNKEWISDNGIWGVRIMPRNPSDTHTRFAICNRKTGFGDIGIAYGHIARIAYNHPDEIPRYVKNKIWNMAGHDGRPC